MLDTSMRQELDNYGRRKDESKKLTSTRNMELIDKIKYDLKNILSERRYIHSLGVMEMSVQLAKIYHVDEEKAKIAGLLHDNAKEMTAEELLKYVDDNDIQISEVERINTKILHGKVGADIAKKKYGISKEIQEAIEYHTTTNPNMTTLDKIVFVADKIELNRKSATYDIETERELAKKDLDEAVIFIINSNITSLIQKDKLINEESIQTRNKLMIGRKNKF